MSGVSGVRGVRGVRGEVGEGSTMGGVEDWEHWTQVQPAYFGAEDL